jgi:hypothetical protein
VGLGACSRNPAAPSAPDPLRLTGSISQAVLAPGQTASLTFRLENRGSEVVTLRFPTGCQILPFVRERQNQRIVYPSGGSWGCTQALTQLILPPGAVAMRTVSIIAADAAGGAASGLPPGDYDAYATVTASDFESRSESVLFSVR